MKLSEKIRKSIAGKERSEEGEFVSKVSPPLIVDAKETFLSAVESLALKDLLLDNQTSSTNVSEDYSSLVGITSQIKGIHHQSALLHGERINAASNLFKSYKESAFSTWLKQVYGNRQTPYNFLKYYLFYCSLTDSLQEKVLNMPKQIVYTIASRNCSEEDKQRVIDTYDGEAKETYLKAIRKAFPLERKDRRQKKKEVSANQVLYLIDAAMEAVHTCKSKFSYENLRAIDAQLKKFSKELWEA
jgi:hypothetical protein